MKNNKRYILSLLFLVNILMLIVPVVPHHHHSNGFICMKQDLPVETVACCDTHNSHPGHESCCDSECVTHFESSTPLVPTDSGPNYLFITTLFTDLIIENLLPPRSKRLKYEYVFRETLHGTDISCAIGLRAPPSSTLA